MKQRLFPPFGLLPLGLLLLAGSPATAHEPAETGSGPDAGTAMGPPIATVNGETLHFDDLERLLGEMHSGATLAQRQAPDVDKMLFRLVNDTLLAQEARALGLQNDEPIPRRVAAKRESLAIERLENEEIRSRVEPTPAEVEEAFREEHQTITFRLLTVRDREEAEGLRVQIDEGAELAALAKEHSIDPYGPRAGLVEDLPRIDMPHELAPVAFALTPGELAGPVSTRIGWTLLRVESVGDADPERLEAVEGSLRALLQFRKAEALRSDLAARLHEAHPVVIDDAVLAAIVSERLPDGRLVPKVEDPAAVVVRVGDRPINAGDLGRALRTRWKGVSNEEAALAAKPLILERMIRNQLMLSEALLRGYGDTPEARRTLRAYETRLLIPRYLSEVVAREITVTPEEMEAYYEVQKDAFRRPPRVHIRQITVGSEEEAERLATLLKEGADLAWLARQHSTDDFKESGGDRGWVTPTMSGDPLEEGLFEAQPGEVLGPSRREDDFIVVQVDAREEQGVFALQDISGNVRKTLHDQKSRQALHELIQTLRSRSEIVLHEDVLATMRISGTPVEKEGHAAGAPPEQGVKVRVEGGER